MSRKYIFGPMLGIRGYIDPSDALIFQAILEHQREQGLAGGAAELGVYYGRSYYLIREHLAQGEKAVACDLFDDSDVGSFRKNGSRLGHPVEDGLVIAGKCEDIRSEDLLSRAGPLRFISLDDGHERHNLAADTALAAATLAPHGVIAFDDFFNPAWPDVTTGIFDFLAAQGGRFAPFCASNKKLYVSEARWADRYRAAVEESPSLAALPRSRRAFVGVEVVLVQHPMPKRLAYEMLTRVGLGGATRFLY